MQENVEVLGAYSAVPRRQGHGERWAHAFPVSRSDLWALDGRRLDGCDWVEWGDPWDADLCHLIGWIERAVY